MKSRDGFGQSSSPERASDRQAQRFYRGRFAIFKTLAERWHAAAGLVRRRWFGLIAGLVLVSTLLTLWIGLIARNSMREVTRESMQTILLANVSSLEMWLSEQRAIARRAAEPESIQSAAAALLSKSTSTKQQESVALPNSAALNTLVSELRNDAHIGWCVVTLDGVVVASSVEGLVQERLPIPETITRRIIGLETAICHPFASPIAMQDSGPLSIPGGPVMASLAPIKNGAIAVGSLMFLLDPLERFTQLLSVARHGQSGETYAFDSDGVMLSRSRFEDQLRDAGKLPSDQRVVSTLNVLIYDPTDEVTVRNKTSSTRNQPRLTFMADQATRGGTGDNVVGYNDYRGVAVVGAWTWLPEYELGVATELDVDEAYRALGLLRRSMLGLLALFGTAVLGIVVLGETTYHMHRKVDLFRESSRGLGKYAMGELLGRGGMGSVYKGTHQLLQRPVAIKVLAKDELDELDELSASRFQREVQLTASLQHPNTIDIYDFGLTDDGVFFYVMEYVDGLTLQELVDCYGAQPPGRVIHLLIQICGSLAEAHQKDMIHRDIKPANLLLSSFAGVSEIIKVVDFGLVKKVSTVSCDDTLTRTDSITGTPMYMSPEAVRDAALTTPQSDLYSVGAVGYVLLTGQPLFDAAGSVDICMKQLNENPIRPIERLGRPLPEDLQNVIMSCLRKNAGERPRTAEDLALALRSCNDANTWDEFESARWWEDVLRSSNADASSCGKTNDGKHDFVTET
ncbi:serine/threonine protein kinase [Rubripirellula amarantea]|nr:serine/threonine protein kinase [Rubripirellula amarantea]